MVASGAYCPVLRLFNIQEIEKPALRSRCVAALVPSIAGTSLLSPWKRKLRSKTVQL
jgi:hypothetical protein